MLSLVILDFDGVIVESEDVKTHAFEQVFARFPEHAVPMMAYHRAHLSAPRREKFAHLVEGRLERPGDGRLIDELTADFSRRVREQVITCPEVPGAAAFLEEFARVLPLYLVSVTPEPDLLAILDARGLRRYFTAIHGCPPWTKERAIEAILVATGVDPGAVLLVGDSPGDLRAAARTSVGFLGRNSGVPFPDPAPALHRDMYGIAAAVRERLAR